MCSLVISRVWTIFNPDFDYWSFCSSHTAKVLPYNFHPLCYSWPLFSSVLRLWRYWFLPLFIALELGKPSCLKEIALLFLFLCLLRYIIISLPPFLHYMLNSFYIVFFGLCLCVYVFWFMFVLVYVFWFVCILSLQFLLNLCFEHLSVFISVFHGFCFTTFWGLCHELLKDSCRCINLQGKLESVKLRALQKPIRIDKASDSNGLHLLNIVEFVNKSSHPQGYRWKKKVKLYGRARVKNITIVWLKSMEFWLISQFF